MAAPDSREESPYILPVTIQGNIMAPKPGIVEQIEEAVVGVFTAAKKKAKKLEKKVAKKTKTTKGAKKKKKVAKKAKRRTRK